jgi:hypothetical protein
MEAKARETLPSSPPPRSCLNDGIPMIPSDCIRADPNRQVLGWGAPKLYYRDELFVCKSCGKLETWTALQQRWWFEIARGLIDSTAVACRACRKAKRAFDAESLHKAWMARFEKLKRFQPQLEKAVWREGPGEEVHLLVDQPLFLFRLNHAALAALAAIRIETLGKLLRYKSTSPLPAFHLSDWDFLLRLIKAKLRP